MFNVVVRMPKVYKNPKMDMMHNQTQYQAFLTRTDPSKRIALMEAPGMDTPEETLFELLAAMEKLLETHPDFLRSPLEARDGPLEEGPLKEVENDYGVFVLDWLFKEGANEVGKIKRPLASPRYK